MASNKYSDIILDISNGVGTIKLNRPKALNSFGGNLMIDIVQALRELNNHPDTVFTVITGEGRFFSAGADVKASGGPKEDFSREADKKVAFMSRYALAVEMLRSMIDHKKVLVLALNGPGVGGGAAWFPGVADIVLASDSSWLQVPFSALGLVPEFGSAINFSQTIGVHRANDFLMFGRKLTAQELEQWGMVQRIFPTASFHNDVKKFLQEQLDVNDGKSMMEAKRLMNAPLRDGRIVAVMNAMDALAERFVEGAPEARFAKKKAELEGKSRVRSLLIDKHGQHNRAGHWQEAKVSSFISSESHGTELAMVIVGKGEEQRKFYIHKKLLAAASEYFDQALNGSFVESAGTLNLLRHCPVVFEVVYQWLYRGRSLRAAELKELHDFNRLYEDTTVGSSVFWLRLYKLADETLIVELKTHAYQELKNMHALPIANMREANVDLVKELFDTSAPLQILQNYFARHAA